MVILRLAAAKRGLPCPPKSHISPQVSWDSHVMDSIRPHATTRKFNIVKPTHMFYVRRNTSEMRQRRGLIMVYPCYHYPRQCATIGFLPATKSEMPAEQEHSRYASRSP
jgi:hypothetical protein